MEVGKRNLSLSWTLSCLPEVWFSRGLQRRRTYYNAPDSLCDLGKHALQRTRLPFAKQKVAFGGLQKVPRRMLRPCIQSSGRHESVHGRGMKIPKNFCPLTQHFKHHFAASIRRRIGSTTANSTPNTDSSAIVSMS